MKLSDTQNSKVASVKTAPTTNTLNLDELVNIADTADAWFKKSIGAKLESVDVIRLDFREAQFNGQKCLTDDGKQIYEIMLTMLTPNGKKRYYSFRLFSNAYKAIGKALNPNNADNVQFVEVVGKNLTLKITGQSGNAYVHECTINGEAKAEVDGVYGVNGEKWGGQ